MRPLLRFLPLLPVFVCLSSRAIAAGPTHWSEVQSPHFVVLTDTNEKQARKVAGELERMRGVFHELLPTATDTAGSPIVVLAMKTKKDFEAVEQPAYLAKGSLARGGYFLRAPDKNYIVLRMDANDEHPYAVVYHEYTHYMLRSASQWMPLWLNEGMAQFYQNSTLREKEVELGKPSADDI